MERLRGAQLLKQKERNEQEREREELRRKREEQAQYASALRASKRAEEIQ